MNSSFRKNITGMLGDDGQIWLESIPKLIKAYEQKWSIKVSEPFTLSYNYVAPAKRLDGTQAVLKIGFPGNKEFLSEIEALKIFKGQGAIRILEEDADTSAILMERVVPGNPLSKLTNDEEATRIAVMVAKKLWRPTPKSDLLIPLERWFQGFERYDKLPSKKKRLPDDLVSKGKMLFSKLLQTTQNPMLIHGDFHHENILSSNREDWLIIDPKGLIGDPIYDLAVFLYNPIPLFIERVDVQKIVEKRIVTFSKELVIDKQRLIEWGIAQSILSAIWSNEDTEEGWEYGINFTKLLLKIQY